MTTGTKPTTFALGPLLYPWNATQIKELYQDAANCSLISRVYLGEIVCAKRSPLLAKYLPKIIDELQAAGKQIIFSTPILHNDEESHQSMLSNIALARQYQYPVEINDLAGLKHATGLEIIIGPYINTYNQASLAVFARNGAQRICPPFEVNRGVIADLAVFGLPLEVNIFGRIALSISSRCFIAHNLNIERDNCKLACFKHSAGFNAGSEQQELFNLNGMQVQSAKIYNLIKEIPDLQSIAVHNFRINPTPEFSLNQISALITAQLSSTPDSFLTEQQNQLFANGFYHNQEGYKFIE